MPRTSLERLKEQEALLKARIRQVADDERRQQRADHTRRTMLLGQLLAEWLQNDEALLQRVRAALPNHVRRDRDRALFDDLLGERLAEERAVGPAHS